VSRVGWIILAGIVLMLGAFVSTCSIGSAPPGSLRDRVVQAIPALRDRPARLVMPVAGAALRDSWGEARGGGARGHHGTDLLAPGGTPVIAAAAGRVEKLFQSRLGGTTAYVRTADGRWVHYYAHLAGYAAGIAEGQRVRAGQVIGYVGDTGDAGPGNYHLHFGVQRMRAGERWWQGEDVNPYPLLAGRTGER